MPHQCTECGRTFPDGSKEMLSGCPDCGGNKFQFDPKGGGDAGGGTDRSSPSDRSDASSPSTDASSPSTDADASGVDHRSDDSTASDSGDHSGESTETADSTGRSWPTYGDEPDSIIGARSSGTGGANADGTNASDGDDGIIEADETPAEDSAQAAARSGFAGPFEVDDGGDGADDAEPAGSDTPDADGPDTPDADGPDTPDATGPDTPDADGTPVDGGEGAVVDEPDDSSEDRPDLAELREELNQQFESIRIKSPGHYELNLMELYDREEYIISLKEDGRYVIEVPETWRSGPDED